MVIVSESFHKDGYANDFTIELEDAPLAHSAIQFCLRDAQYATLGEARRGMERGVKLRDYVQTHVFPKSDPPGLPPPVAPLHVLVLLWTKDLPQRVKHNKPIHGYWCIERWLRTT